MRNSDNLGRFQHSRPADYGMANAAARKVRRDHPSKPVEAVMSLYGLTEGEARGVVYETASRTTLDKFMKAGGWALVVELAADLLGQPLESYIEQQAREAADEKAKWEARERALVGLEAKLRAGVPNRSFLGRDHAE